MFESEFGELVELLQHEIKVNDLSQRCGFAREIEAERFVEAEVKGPIDSIEGPGDVGGSRSLEKAFRRRNSVAWNAFT